MKHPTSRTSATDPALLAYRLLRIAGDRFGCSPQELDSQQRQAAERIAEREQQLEKLVLSSAEARQVMVNQASLEQALEEIRCRYDSVTEFHAALASQQLEETDLRRVLDRDLRMQAVLELVGSRAAAVDETEARLFYYLHPEQFVRPEIRTARHILITVNDDYAENRAEAALKRIQQIGQRLRKHPERFAEQALKHSECPTSLNGGLLGDVRRGTLFPELETRLFSMAAGEISEPVASEMGWHLLLCEAIQTEAQLPLTSVLPQLLEQLQERQRNKTRKEWLQARMAASQTRQPSDTIA